MSPHRLVYRVHAIRRMVQRRITEADILQAVGTGEVIEHYPDDLPYPSRLVLGWSGTRPIHVVLADNDAAGETIVITAYEPDLERWLPGFRTRRRP